MTTGAAIRIILRATHKYKATGACWLRVQVATETTTYPTAEGPCHEGTARYRWGLVVPLGERVQIKARLDSRLDKHAEAVSFADAVQL